MFHICGVYEKFKMVLQISVGFAWAKRLLISFTYLNVWIVQERAQKKDVSITWILYKGNTLVGIEFYFRIDNSVDHNKWSNQRQNLPQSVKIFFQLWCTQSKSAPHFQMSLQKEMLTAVGHKICFMTSDPMWKLTDFFVQWLCKIGLWLTWSRISLFDLRLIINQVKSHLLH